jgi:hypothetical protein
MPPKQSKPKKSLPSKVQAPAESEINSPLPSDVQASGGNQSSFTGQCPAESEINSPLPSDVQASGGNQSSVPEDDSWLFDDPVSIKVPDNTTSVSVQNSLVQTTSPPPPNFYPQPVGHTPPERLFCDPTAVLAVFAIIVDAGLENHVASSVQGPVKRAPPPTFKMMHTSVAMWYQYQIAINSVLKCAGLNLSSDQQICLFKTMGVNPKDTVSFAQIIKLFETPLVLSDETENLIRFPPISAKKDDGAIAADDAIVRDLMLGMLGLVSGENAAILSISLEDMVKHVFNILESHKKVDERFQLFLTVFTRLPPYFFGNRENILDFNGIIQTILFDANKFLLESTKDPKDVYGCCVHVLRYLNRIVTDLSNLTIPVLGLNGEHVSVKNREKVEQMKEHQKDLKFEIKSYLFIVSMLIKWFKLTKEFENGTAVLRFQTPDMKRFFELSLFEFKTFLETKYPSSAFFVNLSFKRQDLIDLALVAVQNNPSCVKHKSCLLGAGSDQYSLTNFLRTVFVMENNNKLVVVSGGVGKGKTTIAFCAAIINLINLNRNGLLFYCGPPHCSNITHIATLCRGIEEYHKSMGQTDVRILPIFDGIVPPYHVGKNADGKQQMVYVVVGTCMNHLYMLLDRVWRDPIHVIIDDNNTVTRSEVMILVRRLNEAALAAKTAHPSPVEEPVKPNRVFIVGSTIKCDVTRGEGVLMIGDSAESTATDIRAIQGIGCIDGVPFTVDQMRSGFNLVSNATKMVQTDAFERLLSDLIQLMNQLKCEHLKCEQYVILFHSYVSSLRKSGVDVRFSKHSFESEPDFFKAFLMFIEAVFVFLKRPDIFPVNTAVMYETIVADLNDSRMNFLDNFLKFLQDYKNQMNEMFGTSRFLLKFPEIPSSTLTQSDIESLSKKLKRLFREIFDRKLTFSFNELRRPPPVPVEERTFSHSPNPTIYVLGRYDNPYNVAKAVAAENAQKFSKVLTNPLDTANVKDSEHKTRRKAGGGGAVRTIDKTEALPTNEGSYQAGSRKGPQSIKPKKVSSSRTTVNENQRKKKTETIGKRSSGGPDDDDHEEDVPDDDVPDDDENDHEDGVLGGMSHDFVESPDDKVTLEFMMKRATDYMETRSVTAPLPDSKSVFQLVNFLYLTRNASWKEILYTFVFGVVVMDYTMTSEMTTLFLDLLCQAQLAHVIQEDRFDLTSMNLPYKGNLMLVFLSEVSNDFCRQLMGRCGRVSTTKNQGIGIVRCETPSGALLLPEPDEAIHSQNDDVMPPIFVCSREQFQSDFDKLPIGFLDKLYRFLSSCKFAKEEFSFINHLLVLFQEVMYNQAFEYCCSDNNVEKIMTFLSCALIVLCGNHLQYYHVFVDARLKCLALNQNALETIVVTTDTLEKIRLSFVQQIRNILPEEADLQSIFGMIRVMEDKSIKYCSMTDLAKMYLSLRRLLDLSHLLEKFLFNIRASKNSHEVNGAVNGLLIMLRSLHDVLDQIMIIIMSFSIPCSTIESVKKMELFSQDEPDAAACSVAADPFVSMMTELRTGLCTLYDVNSCLAKYGKSQCPNCMLVIRDFRGIFSNPEQPQTSGDFLHGRIAIVVRDLNALTQRNAQTIECHNQNVVETKRKIEENRVLHKDNYSKLVKANASLVKTMKDSTTLIESLLQKNKEISEQIEQLKGQLSPYRRLNEKEAVTLFLRQLPQ